MMQEQLVWDILIDVLSFTLSVFIIWQLFHSMKVLGTTHNHRKWREIGGISLYFVLSCVLLFVENPIMNVILLVVVAPLIGTYLYNHSKEYLIRYVILCISILLTEFIATVLVQLLIFGEWIYFNNPFFYQILAIITIRSSEYLILRLVVRVMRWKEQGGMKVSQLLASLLLPVFSIVFLYSLLYLLQIYSGETQVIVFMVNLCLLLAVNIYFSWLLETITKNNQLTKELNQYEQQSKYQYEYYERLEKQYQESRKIIHDVRNHIQQVEELARLHEKEELENYTADIHAMLNKLGLRYYTDQRVLNMILNDKVQKMEECHIEYEIQVHEVELQFMRSLDITTIFANLLDNAIEAAEQVEEGKISFRADQIRDFISVTIQNSCADIPVQQKDRFLSTKTNHDGLGIKNVRRALKQYNGDIQYEIKKNGVQNLIVAQIMIPAC